MAKYFLMNEEKLQTFPLRFQPSVIKRVEAHRDRLRAIHPGLRIERSDALRDLLEDALTRAEKRVAK